MTYRKNAIQEKSFDFSVHIVKFCFEMQRNHREFIITKQLLRSGTSVGANVEEAQGAISKKDFIHKMHISLKEARETSYWLNLINKSDIFESDKIELLKTKSDELVKILNSILYTAKRN